MLRSALVALAIAAAIPAAAGEALVVKESALSVKDTLDALAKAIEAKGLKVFARVDHAAGAKAAGLDMAPAEVLMFGNPKLGTPLMQAKPEIGLDLPLKVLAWQDASGKVRIGYTAPDALKARYGISGKDEVFATMAKALDGLTTAATGGP
ncbi:MAG: DUF302 domain-containing protein [Pseudomonadota bacterium]